MWVERRHKCRQRLFNDMLQNDERPCRPSAKTRFKPSQMQLMKPQPLIDCVVNE